MNYYEKAIAIIEMQTKIITELMRKNAEQEEIIGRMASSRTVRENIEIKQKKGPTAYDCNQCYYTNGEPTEEDCKKCKGE